MEGSCTCIDWRDMEPSPFCKKCGGKGYISYDKRSADKPSMTVLPKDQSVTCKNRDEEILNMVINRLQRVKTYFNNDVEEGIDISIEHVKDVANDLKLLKIK